MFKFIFLLFVPFFLFAKNYWVNAGKEYGIEPKLLYAIAKVESDINVYLVSVNFTKLSSSQINKLKTYLETNNIEYDKFTKIYSINNKNIKQAIATVDFLVKNKYPNFDMGVMQINCVHKETLEKAGITLYDLFNPQINVRIGAYVLAKCFQTHKNPITAINAYNGKAVSNPYSSKVFSQLKKLYVHPSKPDTKKFFKDMG